MSQSVFASRDFRFFFLGQAGSYVGDGLRTIAIPLLVYRLTGSALSLGVTYALEFFPYSIFSLIGGSLADRLDRKRLMIGCDVIRLAIVALFALAVWRNFLTLTMLYVGITLISICGAVFLGSQASSIPFLLGKARATRAVSTLVTTEQIVNTAAPPVGAGLFAIVGPLPALLMNAFTYAVSASALSAVRSFGPEHPGGFPSLRDIRNDVAAGFRFLWADAAMRAQTLASMTANFAGIIGFVALIPYLKHDVHASDFTVGIAFGVSAFGAAIGAFIAGRVSVPFGRAVVVSYLLDGLGWLPIMFSHDVRIIVVFLAISAALGAFGITQIIGWRMRLIPQELVGRVFGVVRLLAIGGALPGALIGGWIGDRFGARTAIAISTIAFLVVAAGLVAQRNVREDRR